MLDTDGQEGFFFNLTTEERQEKLMFTVQLILKSRSAPISDPKNLKTNNSYPAIIIKHKSKNKQL